MITGIDNAIARVLKVLKEKGLNENTIIIYSADNGFMRRIVNGGKWNHYEQSLRIPLIVYDPRLPCETWPRAQRADQQRGSARDFRRLCRSRDSASVSRTLFTFSD